MVQSQEINFMASQKSNQNFTPKSMFPLSLSKSRIFMDQVICLFLILLGPYSEGICLFLILVCPYSEWISYFTESIFRGNLLISYITRSIFRGNLFISYFTGSIFRGNLQVYFTAFTLRGNLFVSYFTVSTLRGNLFLILPCPCSEGSTSIYVCLWINTWFPYHKQPWNCPSRL